MAPGNSCTWTVRLPSERIRHSVQLSPGSEVKQIIALPPVQGRVQHGAQRCDVGRLIDIVRFPVVAQFKGSDLSGVGLHGLKVAGTNGGTGSH